MSFVKRYIINVYSLIFCCSVKVMLHGLGLFATTIFNATQRRSIETMLQLFETMSQRCVALKIVVANRLV